VLPIYKCIDCESGDSLSIYFIMLIHTILVQRVRFHFVFESKNPLTLVDAMPLGCGYIFTISDMLVYDCSFYVRCMTDGESVCLLGHYYLLTVDRM
jgi:hypothetical protein